MSDQTIVERIKSTVRSAGRAVEKRWFPEAADPEDQWQRVHMNRVVDEHIETLTPERLTAVEISGESHADKGWAGFDSLNYPEFDLCKPGDEARQWDVVICEQVLEHVLDPFVAVVTLRRLCKPGGHLIVTSPFLIKQHELPYFGMMDYWRFTPRGLQVMLENAGFVIDEVDSWGNRAGVLGNLGQWSGYRRRHSLRNVPGLAVQIWAFGRNPVDSDSSV